MAGVALGVNSLSSGLYLDQMRDQVNPALLGQQAERVKNVLIVDEEGKIKRQPRQGSGSPIQSGQIDSLCERSKISRFRLCAARSRCLLITPRLPEGMTIGNFTAVNDPGAFYFPVTTTDGTRYVIVVLASANSMMTVLNRQARQSLLYYPGSSSGHDLSDRPGGMAIYAAHQVSVQRRAPHCRG